MAEAESGGFARLWRGRDVVGSVRARDVADSELGLEMWVTEQATYAIVLINGSQLGGLVKEFVLTEVF